MEENGIVKASDCKGFYSDACEAIKSNIQLDLFNESEQMKRRQQHEQQLQLI